MDKVTQTNLVDIHSLDKQVQNDAFLALIAATDKPDKPVDWAYQIWDEMVANLRHKDNHERAIAAQLLCNLAKSDPDNRILKDFSAVLNVTKDDRFVTARHCMQALWKVGVAGKPQQKLYMDGLETRFNECIAEKNCTLIRYDIMVSMRNVYDVLKDDSIKDTALALIETETDLKYRKKYTSVWRKK